MLACQNIFVTMIFRLINLTNKGFFMKKLFSFLIAIMSMFSFCAYAADPNYTLTLDQALNKKGKAGEDEYFKKSPFFFTDKQNHAINEINKNLDGDNNAIWFDFDDDNNLIVTVDKDDSLTEIPDLQKQGIMNQDITQTGINLLSYCLCGWYSFIYLPQILKGIYENTQINKMHVKVVLEDSDAYGNNKDKLMYEFDFSRDIYKKINWMNFKWINIPKVVLNFKQAQWYKIKTQKETESAGI